MPRDFRHNHYVPEWYQHRFLLPESKEKKFFYLDMHPATKVSNGVHYQRKALLRWGPGRCVVEEDLYTTKFGEWESTEIEERFFGKVDSSAQRAIDYFANFRHPSADPDAFHALLPYMSVQKLRTPTGLAHLGSISKLQDRNSVLLALQQLQNLFCALWTESIWSIVDASRASTKFIISDHPVTVYNEGCFPGSQWCKGFRDPEVWMTGTHTLFPLDFEKLLVLTNLSWVRNPYGNPRTLRPNPNPLRAAMFNFMQIQTGRLLTEIEVNEINFIIKARARRYIAAAKEEWLYPERQIPDTRWDRLGRGYLLMPDPRSVTFSTEIIVGYENRAADRFDEYGRRPSQPGFRDDARHQTEWETSHAFQGEFARVFGPRRRGVAFEGGRIDDDEDTTDFHAYHIGLEAKYKPRNARKRGR